MIDAAPPGDLRAEHVPGADAALLVAGRRVARYSRTPLPARRLLTCGRLHTADDAAGTSALRGTADTFLDAASYDQCWVLLSPAPAAGVDRAADTSPIASRTRRQGTRP